MFRLLFKDQEYQSMEDFQSPTENVILKEALQFCKDWISGKGSFTQKTSGSTGIPKSIQILRHQMIASAQATGDFFKIRPEEKLLGCLHPAYIAGKMMLVRAMVWEKEIRLIEPNLEPLLAIPDDYLPDFIAMVPMQVEASLNHPAALAKLQRVKHLLIGGAPLSTTLQEKITQNLNNAWQSFGMTETVSHFALAKIQSGPLHYRPLPQVEIGIDPRDALWVKSPMSGPNKIQTNDQVALQKDGSFTWLGRVDFVVNSGGVKLHPELIERKIEKLIEVYFPGKRFLLGGISQESLGNQLILILESKADVEKAEKLHEVLKETLSRFEIPKEVHFLDSFKETPSGKINRLLTLAHV